MGSCPGVPTSLKASRSVGRSSMSRKPTPTSDVVPRWSQPDEGRVKKKNVTITKQSIVLQCTISTTNIFRICGYHCMDLL